MKIVATLVQISIQNINRKAVIMETPDALKSVQKRHPHMSESLVKSLSIDARVYAGDWAVMILACKTTSQVKQYLKFLVDDSIKAEQEWVAEQERSVMPQTQPKKKKRGA